MKEQTPRPWPDSDAAIAEDPLLRATDPSVRSGWNKVIAEVRDEAKVADPYLFSHGLRERMHRFEAAMYPSYRDILGTTLLWSDGERAFVQWAREAFRSLARAASEALRRDVANDNLLTEAGGELAALALVAYGNAVKWAEIAGAGYDPGCLVEIRRVSELVERSAIGGDRFAVPREDYAESPTLDALLVRALLLDAICRGNLEPRQVEIVDSWLWEWSGEYAFTDTDVGAVLAIDSGRPRGLRPAASDEGRRRYLHIDALEGHIKSVVDGFRAGDIFPGYGLAIEFRVEEHAAALDFLRRFLDSARYRRSRESRAGREQKLEALVGLAEIMPKAFSPRTSPLAPAKPGTEPEAHHGQQLPGLDTLFDIPRRYMRVLDESADGVGVEYDDDPTRPVSVGTVVTLHHDDASPPLLCEVMRRVIPSGGKARLGLRILSRSPKKLKLWRPVVNGAVSAIYVPSDDASGQVDSLLVAESDFHQHENLEARFDDRVFVLRMNRVRYHGRGWHLAGFEVSEERAPA
jgi:hypothetical protein